MILVYKFGLLQPTVNAELVEQQMVLSHRYRNELTQIECGRRAAIRELNRTAGDGARLELDLQAADEAIEAICTQIKKVRATVRTEQLKAGAKVPARGARVTPRELVETLSGAKAERQRAYAALKDYRRALRVDPLIQAETDLINERANELLRSARKHSGVYWGSYLLVEDAMQAAKKAPLYDGADPNDPRYVSWPWWKRVLHGEAVEGLLGVQIQAQAEKAPFTTERAFGEDTRLRIERVPDRLGREKFKDVWAILHMRVGSTSDGKPIFASWPMKMERPLPPGGIISRVAVRLRYVGPRPEWTVMFTVEQEGPATRSRGREALVPVHGGEGAVAVNFGWRWLGEEIRVAKWRGLDGRTGEVKLSAEMVSDLRYAEEVRSRRDKEFDKARDLLLSWLSLGQASEWLQHETKTLASWKGVLRLAAVVKRWKLMVTEAEQEVYTALEAWRYHDHHLWAWESEQRERAIRRRTELYRNVASFLSLNFKTLVIEDFDLSVVAKRPKTDEAWKNDSASSNRQLAAPGELRQAMRKAFEARNGEVKVLPCVDNTKTCHVCGTVEDFDAAASVERHPPCSGCGAEWDQDENNIVVQLANYQASLKAEAAAPPVSAAKKGNRWVKAKEKKAERTERKGVSASAPA